MTPAGRRAPGFPDLFRDASLEQQVRRLGFGVTDAVDSQEQAAFRRIYDEHAPVSGSGFVPSYAAWPTAVKERVAAAVEPLWASVLDRLCLDHQQIFSSFLAKHPGPDSALDLHQDWSYVDEPAHRSLVLWVALDDADGVLDNGPLEVLPGSHLVGLERRGTGTVPWYGPMIPALEPSFTQVPVRAGQAVVMDNRLLHRSPPNRSSSLRLAAAVAITDPDARLIHVTAAGEDEVLLHEVDRRFFLDRDPIGLHQAPLPASDAWATVPLVTEAPDLDLARHLWGIGLPDAADGAPPAPSEVQPPSEPTGSDRAIGRRHRSDAVIDRSTRHAVTTARRWVHHVRERRSKPGGI